MQLEDRPPSNQSHLETKLASKGMNLIKKTIKKQQGDSLLSAYGPDDLMDAGGAAARHNFGKPVSQTGFLDDGVKGCQEDVRYRFPPPRDTKNPEVESSFSACEPAYAGVVEPGGNEYPRPPLLAPQLEGFFDLRLRFETLLHNPPHDPGSLVQAVDLLKIDVGLVPETVNPDVA